MQTIISYIYDGICAITRKFPQRGAQYIDALIYALVGNAPLYHVVRFFEKRKLKGKKDITSICVIADVNIGDAVIAQGALGGLRSMFPHARIDYIIKKKAESLLRNNQGISHVFGVYESAPTPSSQDIHSLQEVLSHNQYEIIINLCPFLKKKDLNVSSRSIIFDYTGLAVRIVRAEKHQNEISHMSHQMNQFMLDIFSSLCTEKDSFKYSGAKVSVSREAIDATSEWIQENNKKGNQKIKILFNPDASSRFTQIPLKTQRHILEKLLALDCVVWWGGGYSNTGDSYEFIRDLFETHANLVAVPEKLSLDSYAALIDASDIFITGDTGPLHIAASERYSSDDGTILRNSTAIYSIFSVTPPRIYGYDSTRIGFCGAQQRAV